jgi:hypothetical protein
VQTKTGKTTRAPDRLPLLEEKKKGAKQLLYLQPENDKAMPAQTPKRKKLPMITRLRLQ